MSVLKKIDGMIRRARKVDEKYIMRQIVLDKRMRDLIIRLNTEDQLYNKGIDSRGRELGNYSPFTIEIKIEKGQRYDHITLNDTGDFYKSFRVLLNGSDIKIDYNDEGKGLALDWGEDIIGLTEENLQRVIDVAKLVILPKVKAYILKQAA